MALGDFIKSIFGDKDEKQNEQAPVLQNKVNDMYGINQKEYNPFLDKSGNVFNKYINYQNVLDNPNVGQKAKEYISKATGLMSTVKETPIVQNSNKLSLSIPGSSPSSSQNSSNSASVPNDKVGFVSAKYEVGGWNGGRVSSGSGDYGGVSYGIPQFSTTTGSADKFASWLKQNYPEMGQAFGNSKAGTQEFSNAWKQVSSKYGDQFANLQTSYAYNSFVQPLVDLAKKKTGIDYTRSPALRELIYSTAIQFGGGSLGLSALGGASADMSDADIVNTSYDKKISNYKNFFKSSSSSVQESVKNRFSRERNDVLGLIN